MTAVSDAPVSTPLLIAGEEPTVLLAEDARKGRDPVRSRPSDRPGLRQDYLPRMLPSPLI
jgi:hypothetical protein